MTERSKSRPDPRTKNLPNGYEWQLKPPPDARSEEEQISLVLNRGQAAARLLRDQDFNDAYQELLDENLSSIVSSKPGQKELREDAYFRLRGIQEFAYKLNVWASSAEQLKQKLEHPEQTREQ